MDFTHAKLPNTLFHMIFVFQRGSDVIDCVFSALHVVGGSMLFGSALFCCGDAGTFDVGDAGMLDVGYFRFSREFISTNWKESSLSGYLVGL